MTLGVDFSYGERLNNPMVDLTRVEQMSTSFLTFSLPLHGSPLCVREAIEAALRSHGEPLRWAITAINPEQKTMQIEAVVTQGEMTSGF